MSPASADNLVMMFCTAVQGDPQFCAAEIQIGPDDGLPVRPVYQGDPGCHAVMEMMNLLHRGSGAENLSNIWVVDRFIIQSKTAGERQGSRKGLQLFDAQQGVLQRHKLARAAADIAVPSARIASANQQIKIYFHVACASQDCL